ncbi:AfsR/SARP family transcriptional regulator [Streptomyces geranii]|uniref:AfsR/SARP family transcriptional regulator n=1 Tax=Streptomyces geranii TaxID=2058923 RepID=UPI001E370F46|nr:BTAD domain-containing putative transcriptional regulator [Streptomyces geranii]
MTEFLLLGTVELRSADGTVVDVGPAKRQTVLAALLVDAGRWVTVETLIDRVWGEELPARVRPSLYAHVSRIRRALASCAGTAGAGPGADEGAERAQLRRGPGGYLLDVPSGGVDVQLFRRLVEQARATDCPDAERVAKLRRALGLWRGEPLSGLAGGWAERTRHGWRQERIEAVLAWADAELRVGEHARVISSLTGAIAEHPLVEPLTMMLMRALQTAGRGAEALTWYTVLQKRLAEELGTDPGAEVQRVHRAILRGESARPATDSPRPPSATGTGQAVVPAQLPLDVRGFGGRQEELARLDGILAAAAGRPAAVVVSAVSGTAGVGKTALAVHWAHRVADRFPDGQLYVNLRGFDPSGAAMTPDQAVRGFLDALGVPAQRVPVDAEARVGLYRSLLAGRRVVVVLDNARDPAQVRPLLPGSAGCLAVVTSRNRLTGLVAAEGAHPVALDLLSPAEAHDLVTHRLGEHRVAAEPDAVEEIVTRCARLPLALAIATARAATRPGLPLARLAAELAAAHGSLTAFTGDSDDPMTDARAVFSWSHRALGPGAARLFTLLGLHPGPDISVPAAAGLTGLPLHQVRTQLGELSDAHLVTEHLPDRYTLHDLLRAYTTEQARTLDPDTEQQPAVRRVLDHYLSAAHAADQLLDPHRTPVTPVRPGPGVSPEPITDHDRALAWFTAEHQVLLAALRQAADAGLDTHAWQLARAMTTFLERRGHWHDLLTTQRAGLSAAERACDERGQAHTRLGLALAHIRLLRFDDAYQHLDQALDLFGRVSDPVGQGYARNKIVMARSLENRYDTEHHLWQALEDFRSADHHVGQATVLNSLGWYHAVRADPHALTYCRQALDLLTKTSDRAISAATWDTYGYAHHQLGQHGQAVDCYHRSLELYRELGDRLGEADTLTHLGDTHHASGETDKVRRTWQQALDVLDDLDHPNAAEVRTRLNTLT